MEGWLLYVLFPHMHYIQMTFLIKASDGPRDHCHSGPSNLLDCHLYLQVHEVHIVVVYLMTDRL